MGVLCRSVGQQNENYTSRSGLYHVASKPAVSRGNDCSRKRIFPLLESPRGLRRRRQRPFV
jgi:hypothetical protein